MAVPSGYTRFNYHLRDWLSMLISASYSYRSIGKILGMHHSTVSREIRKNSISHYNTLRYDPVIAEERARERKRRTRGSKIATDEWLQRFIETMLKSSWSPDVISGYLRVNNSKKYISHETIYKYIYREKREWIPLLAFGHKRRHRRSGKYQNRKKVLIPGRVLIAERPKEVQDRSIFGHYEADTFISRASKVAVLISIERKTRKIRLKKLKRKTADCVRKKLVESLYGNRRSVKSITYDNGTENTMHQEVNKILDCKSYFCNPYHSWERGSVEQAIGLVRRFIPKGRDLSLLTNAELRIIERKINRRPRKLLNYKTPNQVFSEEWCNSD